MIDFAVETTLFGPSRLSFLLPQEDERVTYLKNDYRLQYDFGEFFIIQVEDEVGEDGLALKKIIAEESWMRLADQKRPGGTVIDATPADGLSENILEGTGWHMFLGPTDLTAYHLEANDTNVLSLIWQWAKLTGNEVEFDSLNHTVNMVPTVGLDLGYSFRYSKNLKTVKRTSTPPKTTRVYAYGKNELDITSLTSGGVPYVENYDFYTDQGMLLADVTAVGSPYVKEEILVDETFTDVASLYDFAIRYLNAVSVEQVLYEASVIDLSTLIGYDEATFKCGDTVWVQGEPIRVGERARVSRMKVYPYEPERNELELAFNPVTLPDSQQSSSRRDTSLEWELFESRSISAKQVRLATTIVHRIALQMSAKAEYALHYNVEGTGVGAGTMNIQCVDESTGEALWPTQTFTITNGSRFSWQMSFGDKEVTVGDHVMVVRMWSSASGVGIDIPAKQTAFWILARGTVRENYTLPNSIRFDYTGAVQNWTVPDDITEVLIECHGGSGGTGYGGMVKAMHAVVAGSVLDIIVGGRGTGGGPGWPNGGYASGPFSGNQNGGGGSTDVRPNGSGLASAWIVAGAGGGDGEGTGGFSPAGGMGGFYVGGNGIAAAAGGTQYAGGAGLSPGGDGTFGQGGSATGTGNFFHFGGGGGGGGWYGGEGGYWAPLGTNSGGGGGSGMVDAYCWDIESQDGENNGDGYVIISWENPP